MKAQGTSGELLYISLAPKTMLSFHQHCGGGEASLIPQTIVSTNQLLKRGIEMKRKTFLDLHGTSVHEQIVVHCDNVVRRHVVSVGDNHVSVP